MVERDLMYLPKASKALPDEPSYLQIKNHLMWQCFAKQEKMMDKWSSTCPHCLHLWSDGKFTFKIVKDVSAGPKMKRILRKYSKSPALLNKIENKLVTRHLQRKGNKIVFNCLICRKETSVIVKKPVVLKLKEDNKSFEPQELNSSFKKKKKRDRFSGLNVSAVLSANPSSLASTKKTKKKPRKRHPAFRDSQSYSIPQESLSPQELKSGMNSGHNLIQNDTAKQMENPTQSLSKSTSTLSAGHKLRLLREGQKCKEQQAAAKAKLNIKRNRRLQSFLTTQDKKLDFENRIESLLKL